MGLEITEGSAGAQWHRSGETVLLLRRVVPDNAAQVLELPPATTASGALTHFNPDLHRSLFGNVARIVDGVGSGLTCTHPRYSNGRDSVEIAAPVRSCVLAHADDLTVTVADMTRELDCGDMMLIPADAAVRIDGEPASFSVFELREVSSPTYPASVDRHNPGELYLDLLKSVILGSKWKMDGRTSLDHLHYCLDDVYRQRKLSGDFVETGAWKGGSSIFARAFMLANGLAATNVWVADSFSGLISPVDESEKSDNDRLFFDTYKDDLSHWVVSQEEVENNFRAVNCLDDRVHFVAGWFRDSLPGAPIDRIALLRLDGDYYESTMDALTSLYDKVIPGGTVIIDDYGFPLLGCRRAVDDFFESREIHETISWWNHQIAYFTKSQESRG